MKSLYESILDDEDVLISNVKKSINDPLEIMRSLYDNKDITLEHIIHNLENMSEYALKWVEKNFPSLSELKLSFIPDYKQINNTYCQFYIVDKPNSNNTKINRDKFYNRIALVLYYDGSKNKVGIFCRLLRPDSKIHKTTWRKYDDDELRNDLHNITLKYGLTPEKDFWGEDKIYDLSKKC